MVPFFKKRGGLYLHFLLRAVLQRLQQRLLVQQGAASQIRNGAGHPQQTVVGTCRKPQCIVGAAQQRFCGRGHPADPAYLPGGQLRIAVDVLKARGRIALGLDFPCSLYLLAKRGAVLCRGSTVQLVKSHRVHLHT